ncbi:response regulator transcription factor [Amycolatopsis sp. RTGN1]|nr:helix-turn-helix transcriptional regulator [Amycolatopsis sp. RTGN1]
MSNREIATTLTISLPTVKNHVHSVLEKLNVTRRADVARVSRADPPCGAC